MIQVYRADAKDFLFDHKNFDEKHTNFLFDIQEYIEDGLKDNKVKIIKIRKREAFR